MSYSQEEKAMWLEDWKASGKKAWAYARENGLIPQTFVGWTKREGKGGFVEIPAQAITPLKQVHEIIIEKRDMKIRIPLSAGVKELQALFSVLGAVP